MRIIAVFSILGTAVGAAISFTLPQHYVSRSVDLSQGAVAYNALIASLAQPHHTAKQALIYC